MLGPAWRLPEGTLVERVRPGAVRAARAAQGEDVALLLDGAQGKALASLPFAADLEVVAHSAPLPAALVTTVGSRLAAGRWMALEKGLLALPGQPEGASALDGIRMVGFTVADQATLQAVRALAVPPK